MSVFQCLAHPKQNAETIPALSLL